MAGQECKDVLVVGCGIAGAAAALFAAQQGRTVHIIEQTSKRDETPRPEWIHPDGVAILKAAGVALSDVSLGQIERVRFLDAMSARMTEGELEAPVPVVDATKLRIALTDAAVAAGAAIADGVVAKRINAGEESVEAIDAKGRVHAGRLLILGDGVQTLGRTLPAIARSGEAPRMAAMCEWTGPAGVSSETKRRASELIIRISAQEPENYGYRLALSAVQAVGWIGATSADKARRGLNDCASKLAAPGDAIPNGDLGKSALIRAVPRGVALEMETHVAKRALLIGDAGGFVSAFGHDSLYPALWSARIAADVVHRALDATHPQDVLAEFDSIWRRDMVEHLRIPNTDLRFLIPLVFSNAVMARKLANAFVNGSNI